MVASYSRAGQAEREQVEWNGVNNGDGIVERRRRVLLGVCGWSVCLRLRDCDLVSLKEECDVCWLQARGETV